MSWSDHDARGAAPDLLRRGPSGVPAASTAMSRPLSDRTRDEQSTPGGVPPVGQASDGLMGATGQVGDIGGSVVCRKGDGRIWCQECSGFLRRGIARLRWANTPHSGWRQRESFRCDAGCFPLRDDMSGRGSLEYSLLFETLVETCLGAAPVFLDTELGTIRV